MQPFFGFPHLPQLHENQDKACGPQQILRDFLCYLAVKTLWLREIAKQEGEVKSRYTGNLFEDLMQTNLMRLTMGPVNVSRVITCYIATCHASCSSMLKTSLEARSWNFFCWAHWEKYVFDCIYLCHCLSLLLFCKDKFVFVISYENIFHPYSIAGRNMSLTTYTYLCHCLCKDKFVFAKTNLSLSSVVRILSHPDSVAGRSAAVRAVQFWAEEQVELKHSCKIINLFIYLSF